MKKHLRWGLLIVLCVLFLSPSLANADQDTLTTVSLEEAIQLAYKNNPDIRKADLELEKAQILRNDARKRVDYIPIEGLVSPQYQQVFNKKGEVPSFGVDKNRFFWYSIETLYRIDVQTACLKSLYYKCGVGYSVPQA